MVRDNPMLLIFATAVIVITLLFSFQFATNRDRRAACLEAGGYVEEVNGPLGADSGLWICIGDEPR